MQPVPSNIIKEFPRRGPLQQFRFKDATAFDCLRCGTSKTSKLITIYNGVWAQRLCNGCYGRLLSLYEIKAGTGPDELKAEQLASALLSAVGADYQRQTERLLKASEMRAEKLSAEPLRFLATSEHVSKQLSADPQLEWSPAVIGLCKAVEAEVIGRIIRPLASQLSGHDLAADRNDKDVGRVAAFCADPTRKPPELGAIIHFLETVIHSQRRRESSTVIVGFLRLIARWPGSHWLLDPSGCCHALDLLTKRFRNRAAHIEELAKNDYVCCRELVMGPEGILWRLLLSTEARA